MGLYSLNFFALALVIVPNIALACEGECMVGITNAFLSNYTSHINSVIETVAHDVVNRCFPNDSEYTQSPTALLKPIISSYQKSAYANLENAIFPSYFHGKCQIPDSSGQLVEPDGCPNPDCAVVCGTPGSLVHFYPKLRYIVFNSTKCQLETLASPGSTAYEAVKNKIKAEGRTVNRRRAMINLKLNRSRMTEQLREEQETKCELSDIGQRMALELEKTCGGTGTGVTNGLPDCSWAKEMKEYILSFP